MIFTFSFSKINAKIAAKIGEVYLIETAVPIDRCFRDSKKQTKEISPTTPLSSSSFL